MKDNNFTTLYKTWTTDKLLDILDNPRDYQPLAVEAARFELENRQLTQEQLANAKVEQDLRRQGKAIVQQKVRDFENKVKSVGSNLAETFNPIQTEAPTTGKLIKLISLLIGGLSLYQLYKEFDMLRYMLVDEGGRDFSVVLDILPIILLLTAGILFWYRKKIGWMLATIYFSYTAAGAIQMFIMELNRKANDVLVLDALFPTTSPVVYISTLLIFGGLTWTLCKENMREVYQVNKKSMFIALGIETGIIFLMSVLI